MGDPGTVTAGPSPDERISSEALLAQIRREMDVDTGGQIVHVQDIPARQAEFSRLDAPLPPALQAALEGQGITQLYSHQVEAIERARRGENLVVVTATSSGKTLCYNLPVLETILHDREARALYLYPINALVNDQLKGLMRLDLALGKEAVGIAKYTGGLSSDRRRAAREREPQIVLTNPEMLHLSFLLWHEKWASLWRNLRYVVVDEVHTYRGVFGANMAHLFRRLRRMAAHYGADPQFICCSATMANPKELAETLTGLDFGVGGSRRRRQRPQILCALESAPGRRGREQRAPLLRPGIGGPDAGLYAGQLQHHRLCPCPTAHGEYAAPEPRPGRRGRSARPHRLLSRRLPGRGA